MSYVELNAVGKAFGDTESSTASISPSRRRVHRLRRPFRLRQVHPAAHDRRARGGHARQHPSSTASVSTSAAAERGIAMVFQTYALYPHMTVHENMAFGLKIAQMPRKPRSTSAVERGRRDPADRAAARAQAASSSPAASASASPSAAPSCASRKVFLFDEPLSNLDAELRVQMRVEIAAAAPASSAPP